MRKFERKKPYKVYIAGKIAGDPNYKEKFEKAATVIKNLGDIPLYSTFLPSGLEAEEYMRVCFALIDISDIVYFLPDYKDSGGAQVELAYCKYIGKPYGGLDFDNGCLKPWINLE